MKFALLFAAAILAANTAHAHVVAHPDKGPAGSYFQTSLRVAHGCGESATTELHIKIPENVVTVHPQFKPGWTIKIVKKKRDEPVSAGHGKAVSEAVTEIIWSGSELPADQYDDFGMLMKLPDTPNQTLWFPVTQICSDGQNDWVDIPTAGQKWHALHTPAPFVRVTPAKAN